MAKYTGSYAGSWAKGFASTFSQAPSMIFKALEWKEKKKEKEKIDKAAEEFKINASNFATKIDDVFKDGIVTQQEYSDMTSFGVILGSEYSKEWENLYKNYTEMTSNEINSQLETIKYAFDKWTTLGMGDPEALMGVLDDVGKSTKYDKVKYQVDYLKNAINSRGKEVPKQPSIGDYNTGLDYLKNFINTPPDTFEKVRTGVENKFGFDYSSVTQEALREIGSEVSNLYNTPEEVLTNVKAPAGLNIVPERDTKTGKYYAKFSKETIPAEKEVTPIAFKTLQDIKASFNDVKTKAEYDEALASYNSSKEARDSGWTPPPFENQLTTLIKTVEEAIWADYVDKTTGKLKDKSVYEEYNTNLKHYLDLIEEAKKASIDVSQFQAFKPFKTLYWGAGNPLVIQESW